MKFKIVLVLAIIFFVNGGFCAKMDLESPKESKIENIKETIKFLPEKIKFLSQKWTSKIKSGTSKVFEGMKFWKWSNPLKKSSSENNIEDVKQKNGTFYCSDCSTPLFNTDDRVETDSSYFAFTDHLKTVDIIKSHLDITDQKVMCIN